MLKNFKLVDTTTKAVFFQGDTIRVEDIDDALAEKLIGKTHVLARLAPELTPTAVAPASEPAAADAEAPATSRKRASN